MEGGGRGVSALTSMTNALPTKPTKDWEKCVGRVAALAAYAFVDFNAFSKAGKLLLVGADMTKVAVACTVGVMSNLGMTGAGPLRVVGNQLLGLPLATRVSKFGSAWLVNGFTNLESDNVVQIAVSLFLPTNTIVASGKFVDACF